MTIFAVRRGSHPDVVVFRQVGTRLEYSVDTVTWRLAYDFAHLACVSSEQGTAYTELIEDWDTYDGTTVSIAPDIVYTSTGDDLFRDRAICAAIDSIFQMYDQIARAAASGWPLSILTNAVSAAASIVLTSWPFLSYSTNTYWRILEAGKAAGTSIARDLLAGAPTLDDESMQNLKCCVYSALQGVTPTFDAFVQAFDPDECEFAPSGSPERSVMDAMMSAALSDRSMYLAFLTIAQAMHGLIPLDFNCPCDDRWVHVIDFTRPDILSTFSAYNLSGASVIPLVGLYKNTRFDATFTYPDAYTIIGLGAEYDMATGPGASSPYIRVWFNNPTPPGYIVFQNSTIGASVNWVMWQAAYPVTGTVRLEVRHVSSIYTADATFRKLYIYGQGANPFD